MENDNETDLIRELKEGSLRAFDALYEIYFPKVYSYCLQISKSPQTAADISQEVFMKLWEHRRRIRLCDSINPFLFKIAKNRLISAYREAVNSKIYEDYVIYSHSRQTDKQSPVEYHDFLKILNKSVNELPKLEREVIMLSRFRLMKNQEIAKYVGISEQTVKNRLVSGIKHLRELLEKYNHLVILYSLLLQQYYYSN